jgi:hypothetical protein
LLMYNVNLQFLTCNLQFAMKDCNEASARSVRRSPGVRNG